MSEETVPTSAKKIGRGIPDAARPAAQEGRGLSVTEKPRPLRAHGVEPVRVASLHQRLGTVQGATRVKRSKQQLMTRAGFTRWIGQNSVRVFARAPYRIEPCDCRDVNCHGWRFLGVIDRPRETAEPVMSLTRRELQLAPLEHEF